MQSVVVIVVLALALIALLGRAETVLDAELEHSRSAEIENTGEAVDPINNNSNGDGEGEGEGNSYSNGAAVTQAEKMRIYEELSTEIVRIEQLLDSGKPGEAMQLIRVYNSKTGSNTVGDAVSDAVSDTSLEDRVAICLARAYAQTGKYKESELVLKEVLKRNENHITALVTIGKLYYQLQNLNEAQFYFQKVIQLVESDNGSIDSRSSGVEVAYQAYVLLGKLVLVRDSNNAKAKDLLLHANELKPNDERVLFDLGMVLFHNNNHNEAKEMFERAEMINNQMDHKLVGSVYIHFGHLDWASTALEKAVENMKKNLKYSGGNSLSNSYNKNIINKDKFDAELVLLLAECVESLGDRSKALNLYRWVLAIYPENALAHAGRESMIDGGEVFTDDEVFHV